MSEGWMDGTLHIKYPTERCQDFDVRLLHFQCGGKNRPAKRWEGHAYAPTDRKEAHFAVEMDHK